jgi:hypothetical protein
VREGEALKLPTSSTEPYQRRCVAKSDWHSICQHGQSACKCTRELHFREFELVIGIMFVMFPNELSGDSSLLLSKGMEAAATAI